MLTSIYTQYFRYTLPTVAAMLVSGLYQLIDGIFVGQYLGASGLAGVNVAWPMIGVIVGTGLLVGVGTGALASIYRGRGDLRAARQTIVTGLLLSVLFAILISGLLWLSVHTLLLWQTDEPSVFHFAMDYMHVALLTSVFTLGATVLPFLIRNDDRPNFATILMIGGAALNIIFDYLFIVLFDMALQGAAIATAISQCVVTVIGLRYFFSSSAHLRLKFSDFSFLWRDVYQIIVVGLSSFFMYLYWGIMVALHNSQFAKYGGTEALGAYTILGYIVTFYYLVVEGIANGMQPLASFNFGAQVYANIKKLFILALSLALLFGLGTTLVLNLYPQSIIAIFNQNNAQLLEHAITGIHLHIFALCLDGFLVVVIAFYQSINQGKKAMILSIGSIVIQIPFLFLLPIFWGLTGVWLAFPLSNIALSLIVAVLLTKDIRRLFQSISI